MKFSFNGKLWLLVPIFVLIQCKKDQVPTDNYSNKHTATTTDPNKQVVKVDTVIDGKPVEVKKEIPKTVIPNKDFHYTALAMKKNDSLVKEFKKKYSADELYTILAINRLDRKNITRPDTLVVPSVIEKDFLKYSPFPGNVPVLQDVKKFVFFSYPIQAFGVYEYGNLVKWGPTSMGKKASQTDRGLHFANWKKEVSISTVSDEWKLRWNFNISNFKGIGWHQYEMPGYPASHSCLRMLEEDAKWMYSFADTWILNKGGATVRANGTPVYVYGDYKWGGRKPWYNLMDDPKANDMSVDDITKVIQPELDKILKEQDNRDKVAAQVLIEKAEKKRQDSLSIGGV